MTRPGLPLRTHHNCPDMPCNPSLGLFHANMGHSTLPLSGTTLRSLLSRRRIRTEIAYVDRRRTPHFERGISHLVATALHGCCSHATALTMLCLQLRPLGDWPLGDFCTQHIRFLNLPTFGPVAKMTCKQAEHRRRSSRASKCEQVRIELSAVIMNLAIAVAGALSACLSADVIVPQATE